MRDGGGRGLLTAVQPIRGRVRHEARSCGLLRAGTVAEIYELPDRAAFFGRDRPRHLCRVAQGDTATSPLPYTPPPCAAKSIWYRGRSSAASRWTTSTLAAARRQSWRRRYSPI